MLKSIPCLLALAVLAGCATAPDKPIDPLPPISDPATGLSNPGQIIWHDLATRDLDQSMAFYGDLFGWEYKKRTLKKRPYAEIYLNGTIIGGMFPFTSDEKPNPSGEWLSSISTADVQATADAFVEAGGEILEPQRDVPDRGTLAFVRDPQEAVFLLAKSSSGDPVDSLPPVNSWLWNELWTHDIEAARELYESTFGYTPEKVETGPHRSYYLLKKNDEAVAGILELLEKDVRPHWVPFIRVKDVQAAFDKAVALGANPLIEPNPEVRRGMVALLQGPTGEPFVIQMFEPASE